MRLFSTLILTTRNWVMMFPIPLDEQSLIFGWVKFLLGLVSWSVKKKVFVLMNKVLYLARWRFWLAPSFLLKNAKIKVFLIIWTWFPFYFGLFFFLFGLGLLVGDLPDEDGVLRHGGKLVLEHVGTGDGQALPCETKINN